MAKIKSDVPVDVVGGNIATATARRR